MARLSSCCGVEEGDFEGFCGQCREATSFEEECESCTDLMTEWVDIDDKMICLDCAAKK